jgi:nitrate reductase gamma subunit
MTETLHFAETTLQEAALLWMGTVYIIRLWWLTNRFKATKERQAPTGTGTPKPTASIIFSEGNIAMPWAMESSRQHWFMYLQFVVFHLGVVVAIGLTFIIPYVPQLLASGALVYFFQTILALAFIVGIMRIVHRFANKHMRAISSPDDYFSLVLLTIFFAFAFLAAPNDISKGETIMVAYFWITAFFLVYVPFSKISHYLYYPFTRYYLGKSLGRRGVFPLTRSTNL